MDKNICEICGKETFDFYICIVCEREGCSDCIEDEVCILCESETPANY